MDVTQKAPLQDTWSKILYGRKYEFMEVNTQRRGGGLKEKIPDIQKTLDTVKFLKTRQVSGPPGRNHLAI